MRSTSKLLHTEGNLALNACGKSKHFDLRPTLSTVKFVFFSVHFTEKNFIKKGMWFPK